ncbi:MAG: hypothetical protein NT013_24160 [Planctomycetia bacterium]|nr:hypothetical protein [Planctomycetia bacterium]
MSFQPKVYTFGHVLFMTGMVIFGTVVCYVKGQGAEQAGMKWFAETWLLYVGAGATFLTFLFGMGLLGKPWYDAETNKQLKAEYDRAMLEWRFKSPEEKAILMAAEENRLLQLTQIMQNNQIINNQEQIKKTGRS